MGRAATRRGSCFMITDGMGVGMDAYAHVHPTLHLARVVHITVQALRHVHENTSMIWMWPCSKTWVRRTERMFRCASVRISIEELAQEVLHCDLEAAFTTPRHIPVLPVPRSTHCWSTTTRLCGHRVLSSWERSFSRRSDTFICAPVRGWRGVLSCKSVESAHL